MTALLLAAAFCLRGGTPGNGGTDHAGNRSPARPTEWADEAQDVTEAEEAPVYQQADAQEVETGETAASLDRYGSRLHGTVY